MTTVDCSYQAIYALSKILQSSGNILNLRFQIYFALLGSLLIKKKLLIANEQLVGTGLEENLGDTSSYTAGLQTATVEVNLIHKAKYSVRLSVVQICICQKEASKTVLPSYSWAEEPSLFSRMFKYWTLIMKFQICL